jgi:hypothetical protein
VVAGVEKHVESDLLDGAGRSCVGYGGDADSYEKHSPPLQNGHTGLCRVVPTTA